MLPSTWVAWFFKNCGLVPTWPACSQLMLPSMPCMSVDASVMGSGSMWCSDTWRAVGGFIHNCGMVGTGSVIADVDLVGTSWVLVYIFSIKSCFSVRFTFLSGYTGFKFGDGTRDVTIVESTAKPRDCADCLVGAGSLAESSRRCGRLVVLLSAGSSRHLTPAFIHSPYGLGCCSRLGSCKVQFFFSWPKWPFGLCWNTRFVTSAFCQARTHAHAELEETQATNVSLTSTHRFIKLSQTRVTVHGPFQKIR